MDTGFLVVVADAVVDGAVDAGCRPDPWRVRALAEGDLPVLVRCLPTPAASGESGAAETVALASCYAWLGARVFATPHPHAVRRALDMVAAIQGTRPPAVARRGLA